jgi:hypothetical protein
MTKALLVSRHTRNKLGAVLTGILFVSTSLPFASAQSKADDKKILDDMRQSYSTLQRQGLVELKASVTPNWEPLLVGVAPARRPAALMLAAKLHFSVMADAKGLVTVTHQIMERPPDKVAAQALETLAKGIEQSVYGFLMSWVPFMLSHLIPDKLDHFVLQDLGKEYLLSFKDSGTDVSVSFTKEFVIRELKTSQGSIKPQLLQTSKGFVLTGYEGDYQDAALGHVTLKATLDSQVVGRLQLPRKVVLSTTIGENRTRMELGFTNYQLKTVLPNEHK